MSEEENVLSEDDKAQMKKDIEDARKSLVSEDTEKKISQAREEARQQALKEVETQRLLEEHKKREEELRKQLDENQRKSAEQLEQLSKKVDSLSTSKAPARLEDPFGVPQKPQEGNHPVDRMDDAQIEKLERSSAREFFGHDYDRMINNL